MELKHTKKLDIVLSAIGDKASNPYDYNSLFEFLTAIKADISEIELKMIIRKLKAAGYISDISTTNYQLSFDGYVFDEQGGYTAKALKDTNTALLVQMEVDRRIQQDALLAKNSTELNALTGRLLRWTKVAAVVGSLVVLYYVGSWFFPRYSDYPYHLWFEKEWINTPVKK